MEKYPFLFAIIKRCEIQVASCVLASSGIGFVKIINEFRVEKNNKILKEFKAHHRDLRKIPFPDASPPACQSTVTQVRIISLLIALRCCS